jgi:hypothetical protein
MVIETSNIVINFKILYKITLRIYFLDYKLITVDRIINSTFNRTNIIITNISKYS